MSVAIRLIDEADEQTCAGLRVTKDQASLIAPNSASLEWARSSPTCVPLGIHLGDTLVGFAMYEPRGNGVYSVHRFMIDADYQRRGIGRAAMQLVMREIQGQGGVTIYLSMRPENVAARQLFTGLGFIEHEVEADGEVVYRYGPVRSFPL